MSNFTKSPWKAVRNGAGAWTVEFECGPIRGNEYLQINTTSSIDEECCNEGETARHNAHLISAAPEMYEMLDELTGILSQDATHVREAYIGYIEKLLAKARGEHV